MNPHVMSLQHVFDNLCEYIKKDPSSLSSEESMNLNNIWIELRNKFKCMGKAEKHVIFLGPPGCGKGTQGQLLSQYENKDVKIHHLSTGDMLRQAVGANTDIGLRVREVLARGELVDDDTVIGLLREKLCSDSKIRKAFILDGFPRNEQQAEKLEVLTKELDCHIDFVVYFDAPDDILVERVCGRRIHEPSGRIYHIKFNPPLIEGLDDITKEPLKHREDDNEITFRKRLEIYHQETKAVLSYYNKRDNLIRLDATLSIKQMQMILEKMLCCP